MRVLSIGNSIKEFFTGVSTVDLEIKEKDHELLVKDAQNTINKLKEILGKSMTDSLLEKYFKPFKTKEEGLVNLSINKLLYLELDSKK